MDQQLISTAFWNRSARVRESAALAVVRGSWRRSRSHLFGAKIGCCREASRLLAEEKGSDWPAGFFHSPQRLEMEGVVIKGAISPGGKGRWMKTEAPSSRRKDMSERKGEVGL
ncbi:unnamed protein product [Victoria cruziana]